MLYQIPEMARFLPEVLSIVRRGVRVRGEPCIFLIVWRIELAGSGNVPSLGV